MKMDREEHKVGIGDAFAAIKDAFAAVFGKQKDNKMLRDLNIKKGFFPGVGYVLYIAFVLPFRVFAWIMTPRWAWVHFVQRHLVSPLFEIQAISGDESPSKILGGIYEKNINYLKTQEDSGVQHSTLKPEVSSLERIVIFAKIRVMLTLMIFATAAFVIYDYLDVIADLVSNIGALVGLSSTGFEFDNGGAFTSLAWGATAKYVIGGLFAVYFSYIFIFAIRFMVESVKSLMYADREMLKDFVDDSLHYTISKTIDLYGKDNALAAYDLLLENIVTDRDRYVKDEPFYKLLEQQEEAEDENKELPYEADDSIEPEEDR